MIGRASASHTRTALRQLLPGQVCWRGDNVTVPFNVTRGIIPTPAAVQYNLTVLAGNLTGVPHAEQKGHISLAEADLEGDYELQVSSPGLLQ